MKIAISSQGKGLDDKVDPRFGRAPYFVVIDPETLEFSSVSNDQNLSLPQGAGIQAAQNVINQGVEAVLTGNCGPKAFKTLMAAKVGVYVAVAGTIRDALDRFKAGQLVKSDEANVEGHWM